MERRQARAEDDEGGRTRAPMWAQAETVAHLFDVPRTRLFCWIKAGEVESCVVGRRRLVRLASVDEHLRALADAGVR